MDGIPTKRGQFIIFECGLDLTMNIIATCVVSSIKKAHPEREIIVITHFPQVWLHNPNVFRVYKFGQFHYFYDDFVHEKDSLIFRHNPFNTEEYMKGTKHIAAIWAGLCGVEYDGSLPSLHFTWREEEAVQNMTRSPKPLFFIQASGSADPKQTSRWSTDIPRAIAEKICNAMRKKGYQIIELREAHHRPLPGTDLTGIDLRLTLYSIHLSSARLFIDSYAAQAAAALNIPSAVTFVTSDPKITGWDIHQNIVPKVEGELKNYIESFKDPYDFTGSQRTSPHSLDGIYNADEIVEVLSKQTKK